MSDLQFAVGRVVRLAAVKFVLSKSVAGYQEL